MRFNYIANAIGLLLFDIGFMILIPLVVALILKENICALAFFTAAILSLFIGAILRKAEKRSKQDDALNDIKRTEALVVASLAWVLFGLIACIPFLFNGFSFIDSFFESVSGITTTGATILTSFDIPKSL